MPGVAIELISTAEPAHQTVRQAREDTCAPVTGTGASQSDGASEPGNDGAASPASGAERAASWDAATRSAITAGSTSLDRTDPTWALSP